ncbi:translation elongation factor Ts [Candidatus Curculioniphilus buchneri]|uniref:translation elongation factor Ts n=1 Tax=Candidatus Curculioniphilus buchneri TaxID=690594 RepID=UPI00376F1B16
MVDISIALVKELRERTGIGIMECKEFLVKAQGNIEVAIDNMRKSGQLKASKRASRTAYEGLILIKIEQSRKYGAIIEINCESDFVVKNADFRNFSDTVITTALKENIKDIHVLKDKFEDQTRMLISKINENIVIRRIDTIKGDILGYYLHGTRIGVIVSATNASEELAKKIAMHIAASKPVYLKADEIPSDVIAREHQIQMELAMHSGKTHKIAEIIVDGRMKKFTQEISLISQHFVMDPNKTIEQLLDEHDCKIDAFIRFEVGEKIKSEKH